MPTYDLKNFSPYDFELLVKDLLQEELKLPLESFTSGKDRGIDIRYSKNKKNNIIIQCKHYVSSTLSNLISNLKLEKPKVDKLKPDRYLIVTSLGLSPEAKNRIDSVFSPYIVNQADILGLEAINSLIRKYPKIEKRHYKLWMTSSEVLKHILHSSVYNRSNIDIKQIHQKAKIYVQNKSFKTALKILGKNHYCIISGVPGIGKTTLAEILCLKYLMRGYELISISTNIEDAYKTLDEESKQIFLFDDFLGNILFENRLKDSSILKFIDLISKSKNKRFILTTREYILQQAIVNSEGYARVQLKKCIVKQEDYTRKIKAYILYNHLYFSGLGREYINAISKGKNYLEIANHKTFSPRIIEWMTNSLNVQNIPATQYAKEFINALNSPKIIWKFAFEKHLSPYSRSIVVLLGLVKDNISLNDFKILFKAWDQTNSNDIIEWQVRFNESLRELDGTFIKIDGHSEAIIKHHNPSIKDFILDYLESNTELIERFLSMKLVFWDQFAWVMILLEQKRNEISSDKILKIVELLIKNFNLPALEVKYVYGDQVIKKEISAFEKLRHLLDLAKDIKGFGFIHKKLFKLVLKETRTNFEANYDVYFCYSKLTKLLSIDDFKETKMILQDRIRKSMNYYELNELTDILGLVCHDFDEAKEFAKGRFDELESEYVLEDSLNQLQKTEEAICDFIGSRKPPTSRSLELVRSKISFLMAKEEDYDQDYDDHDYNEEKLSSEQQERTEIDEMFSTLLT